jgi:hypothetical protein
MFKIQHCQKKKEIKVRTHRYTGICNPVLTTAFVAVTKGENNPNVCEWMKNVNKM